MPNSPDNYQTDSVDVALNIYGYQDGLERLTQEIGLQPDRQHEKDGKKFRRDFWSFQSKLRSDASINEHLIWLLEALRPHKDAVQRIARECEVKISVGAKYFWYNPEFELDPAMVSEIADLGVRLWFDIYCFPKDHLAEDFQQEQFKQLLRSRKTVQKLGVSSEAEIAAITEVLHLLEAYAASIPEIFFPDYGFGEDIRDDDLAEALPKLRADLAQLLSAVQKSAYLSGSSTAIEE